MSTQWGHVERGQFMLRFYAPVNSIGSCRARPVYLIKHLLGRLSSKRLTSIVHILSSTALLESVEGERMTVEIFHDQSPRKDVADLGGGRTRDLLVSSRTRIHLSHRGRQPLSQTAWEAFH